MKAGALPAFIDINEGVSKLSYFCPTIYVNKVTDIDKECLLKHDIRAILLDIDNTLSPHCAAMPFDGVKEWIDEIKNSNINLSILTNRSDLKDVEVFAKNLSLGFVMNAKKPLQSGFNRAISTLKLPRENVLLVGDQIFTDILGANIAKIKSALVEPQDKNESIFIKFKRLFELPFRSAIRYNKKMNAKK